MTTPSIECCICGSTDKWQNVDQYRLKPVNMCLCMNCGFVTYPDTIAKSVELKEFYREDYRETPTVQALYTGQRKLHYHNDFLKDLFSEWKKENFSPKVFEIGCAIGMFLDWIRKVFPKAEINGTELTKTHVNIAKNLYGISLQEEFDATKKYDLIATYKVAEHIPNIHKELRKYAECLTEKGYLYISVPTWFGVLNNFGASGFSLEYYYHTNHINVWSRKLFETLLKKCGLEIVKENHVTYDSTYLCKRNDSLMSVVPEYESPYEILDHLDKIKQAAMLFDLGKYNEAAGIWPNFPDAVINAYESSRAMLHKLKWEGIYENVIQKAQNACPGSYAVMVFSVDLCLRYDQYDKALEYIEKCLEIKPFDSNALIALGSTYRQMAARAETKDDQIKFYLEARDAMKILHQTSFESAAQAMTWILSDNAKIPADYLDKNKVMPGLTIATS